MAHYAVPIRMIRLMMVNLLAMVLCVMLIFVIHTRLHISLLSPTVHHDMLPLLMSLIIHVVGIV